MKQSEYEEYLELVIDELEYKYNLQTRECANLLVKREDAEEHCIERLKKCEKYIRENKKLNKELKEVERDLEHRDTILSVMYDLVRSEEVSDKRKLLIIKKVIDVESWAERTYKRKDKDVENFFRRIFRP